EAVGGRARPGPRSLRQRGAAARGQAPRRDGRARGVQVRVGPHAAGGPARAPHARPDGSGRETPRSPSGQPPEHPDGRENARGADDGGFGFAIAKALAEAGASICVGTWPPALGIFTKLLERGKIAGSLQLSDGSGKLEFERIYPLDAAFDALADAPAEVRENKRYREVGDFSVQ